MLVADETMLSMLAMYEQSTPLSSQPAILCRQPMPLQTRSSTICSSSIANSDQDTALALGLSLAGLPVCLYFLVKTWRRWVSSHRRNSRSSVSSQVIASNPQLAANLRPVKHDPGRATLWKPNRTLHIAVPNRSHSHHSIPDVQNAHRDGQVHGVWHESVITRVTFWTGRLLQPQGLNQLLSNLLLCSWTILTYDQICHILFLSTITFACPQYNCRAHTSFATPGCAAAIFEGLQLVVQPFGVCCFAIASVNRFINVYSWLSRGRYIVLHVGTILICFVCTGLSVVTIWTYVITSSLPSLSNNVIHSNQVKQAQELLILTDFVTYIVLGSVTTLALIMGLHYIIKIRKEVSALRPTIATASLFQASADAIAAGGEAKAAAAAFSHGLVVVSTAAIPSSPSSPTLLIVPVDPGRLSSPSPIHTTATAGLAGNALDGPLPPSSFARGRSSTWLQRRKLKREKSVATGLCILLNMCIMVVFPIMHPYVNTQPKGTGDEDRTRSTSALFDSAFMLICQKLFAGTVTAAINQMTELVLSTSNNELQ